jgi:hypothetical protein
VYGGSLADTASLISPEAAAGKFVIFSPAPAAPTGGRGAQQAAPNVCVAILNPGAATGRGAGRGGFGGFGGGANPTQRYMMSAAAVAVADLDLTPMGRRAAINDPVATAAQQPAPTPRAPIVVTHNGVIGTVNNGQIVGGSLPNGMTAAQLQQQIDSMRADSIARVRREARYEAQEAVAACAPQDSIAVSHGGASMMGPGGRAAADSAALAAVAAVGSGRGGGGGGGRGGRGGFGGATGEAPVASLRITKAAATQLLGRAPDGMSPGTAGKTVTANLAWEERDASDWARNVVAMVPGSDPALKGQYVLVSAHNDHVGYSMAQGPAVFNVADHDSLKAWNDARQRLRLSQLAGDLVPESEIADEVAKIRINVDSLHRIRPARLDSINNGADDDGSGSMGILEIAEYIAKMPVKPKRSTLFVWQTGEEGGLRGSAYFATHPTVPVDSIVADINIDMIGRGRAEDIPGAGPTYVGVVGSGFMSKDLANVVAGVNLRQKQPLALDRRFDSFTTWPGYNNIYGRSDHYNYARQCIPIAFFFTGLHGDYHQRTDEPQYIDYPHYNLITNYIRDVVVELGTRQKRPDLEKPCLR